MTALQRDEQKELSSAVTDRIGLSCRQTTVLRRNLWSARWPRALALLLCARISGSGVPAAQTAPASTPTFYHDVLPILQDRCQSCHRREGIAPMPLETYDQARAWAGAIAESVRSRLMPPWFADPCCGRFANDPSLTSQQVASIVRWAEAGAPAGDAGDSPAPHGWNGGWSIPQPDAIVKMPAPVSIPAHGDVEYTYEIVRTGFTADTWVQMAQVIPASPEHVHHAVVYIRPSGSKWLEHAPVGVPFTASGLKGARTRRDAHWTDSDILLVYAPGSSPDRWPDTMAKFIPAGSDLVFQMHYTTNGHPGSDQACVGLVFAKAPAKQRVLTLQLTNDHFVIPPGVDDFRVEAHGTLPHDALLLSFLPHMHLRGKRFEYNIVHPDSRIEPLLRVNYDFHWQLTYRLEEPQPLKAGTELEAVAWYDNSRRNPHNPDPDRAVTWGDQTYDEMMVGFFDVAVPADMDKWQFFSRRSDEGR